MKEGRAKEVTQYLEDYTNKHANNCKYYKVKEGDALEILHHNPQELAKVVDRIKVDLEDLDCKVTMRFALDFGIMECKINNGHLEPVGGIPLRTSARIEPMVTPGEIWATEAFVNYLNLTNGIYTAKQITKTDYPQNDKLHFNDKGEINIKKEGSQEPDQYIRLYRIIRK